MMSYAAETWNMVREQLSNNLSQTKVLECSIYATSSTFLF